MEKGLVYAKNLWVALLKVWDWHWFHSFTWKDCKFIQKCSLIWGKECWRSIRKILQIERNTDERNIDEKKKHERKTENYQDVKSFERKRFKFTNCLHEKHGNRKTTYLTGRRNKRNEWYRKFGVRFRLVSKTLIEGSNALLRLFSNINCQSYQLKNQREDSIKNLWNYINGES